MDMFIDIETFSATDLVSCGVFKYSEDPEFEVLLFGYAFNDEPVEVIDLTGAELPPRLADALTDPGITKHAWNAAFERTCLAAWMKEPMLPEQWNDTMILAANCGLPLGLDACCKALNLDASAAKVSWTS